jgi:hypothetical protein
VDRLPDIDGRLGSQDEADARYLREVGTRQVRQLGRRLGRRRWWVMVTVEGTM